MRTAIITLALVALAACSTPQNATVTDDAFRTESRNPRERMRRCEPPACHADTLGTNRVTRSEPAASGPR